MTDDEHRVLRRALRYRIEVLADREQVFRAGMENPQHIIEERETCERLLARDEETML